MAKDEVMLRVRNIWSLMMAHSKSKDYYENALSVSRLLLLFPELYWYEDDGELPSPH